MAISPDSGRNQISSRQDLRALVAAGRSYRLIDRKLGPSKKTVAEIAKRARAERFTREPQKFPICPLSVNPAPVLWRDPDYATATEGAASNRSSHYDHLA
ncbi:MAG TPA: hypothetical protein VGR45_12865 [Stellaceae bacterium]|nr:hypothetical protein [Stellaceae bacterium]